MATRTPAEPASAAMVWGSAITPIASRRDPPPSAQGRDLDGYTAVAVLAIVVFTVYQFCNVNHFLYQGTLGYTVLNSLDAAIPWFFVLAGYRLFQPIARAAIDGAPRVSNRRFLNRRAVQFLPAYYVAVAVVWFSRQHSLPGDWRDLLEHLTFTQVFDDKRIFYTNGPAWAIAVLIQLCVLLAALNLTLPGICRRLHSRQQRITAVGLAIGLLAAVSLSWKAWSFTVQHRPTTGAFTTWFGPAANLDNFAVGMTVALIAVAARDHHRLGLRCRSGLRLIALALLAAAFAVRTANSWTSVYFSSECSVAFGCLIAAIAFHDNKHPRLRTTVTPLTWIATIGYGTYLWQEPILLGLRSWDKAVRQAPDAFLQDTTAVVIVSLLAGWLSHTIIERPVKQLAAVLTATPATHPTCTSSCAATAQNRTIIPHR